MKEKTAATVAKGAYVPDALWETFNITPEMLRGLKVIESSVYLTRECNLKCQYCKIIKTEVEGELSTEKWIEAFDILDSVGIRFVNIAGGEPTIVKGLSKMIEHLATKTSMEFSIVSNSLFGPEKAREMAEAGLKNFVASVDVVGGNDNALDELRKSSAGVKALAMLRELGVENLCANIVINGTNLDDVLDVTRVLSDSGVWVNICPIVWGKGDNWEAPTEADMAYQLTSSMRDKLSTISSELIRMKRAGALILPTEEYILGIPDHGIDLDWKCYSDKVKTVPPRLTIDSDGTLLTCINMRETVTKKHSVFELKDPVRYQEFMDDWYEDAKKCTGCYWSTMVMATERQQTLEGLKSRMEGGKE